MDGPEASEQTPQTQQTVNFDNFSNTCRRCRTRKQKCDGTLPACDRCVRVGAFCDYPVKKKPGRKVGQPEDNPTTKSGPGGNVFGMSNSLEKLTCRLKYNTTMRKLLDASNATLAWLAPKFKFRTYAAADFWEAAQVFDASTVDLKKCSPSQVETLVSLLFHILLFAGGTIVTEDEENANLFGKKAMDLIDILFIKHDTVPSSELLHDVLMAMTICYILNREDPGKYLRERDQLLEIVIEKLGRKASKREDTEVALMMFTHARLIRHPSLDPESWEEHYQRVSNMDFDKGKEDYHSFLNIVASSFTVMVGLFGDRFSPGDKAWRDPEELNLTAWEEDAYRRTLTLHYRLQPVADHLNSVEKTPELRFLTSGIFASLGFLLYHLKEFTQAGQAASRAYKSMANLGISEHVKLPFLWVLRVLSVLDPDKYRAMRAGFGDHNFGDRWAPLVRKFDMYASKIGSTKPENGEKRRHLEIDDEEDDSGYDRKRQCAGERSFRSMEFRSAATPPVWSLCGFGQESGGGMLSFLSSPNLNGLSDWPPVTITQNNTESTPGGPHQLIPTVTLSAGTAGHSATSDLNTGAIHIMEQTQQQSEMLQSLFKEMSADSHFAMQNAAARSNP